MKFMLGKFAAIYNRKVPKSKSCNSKSVIIYWQCIQICSHPILSHSLILFLCLVNRVNCFTINHQSATKKVTSNFISVFVEILNDKTGIVM